MGAEAIIWNLLGSLASGDRLIFIKKKKTENKHLLITALWIPVLTFCLTGRRGKGGKRTKAVGGKGIKKSGLHMLIDMGRIPSYSGFSVLLTPWIQGNCFWFTPIWVEQNHSLSFSKTNICYLERKTEESQNVTHSWAEILSNARIWVFLVCKQRRRECVDGCHGDCSGTVRGAV